MRRTSSLLLAFLLCSVGCGGGSPLVGTWHLDVFTVVPTISMLADRADSDLTLQADGQASSVGVVVFKSTSPQYPGCTYTTRSTGFTWMSSMLNGTNTLTIGGTGTITEARTGCMQASDNLAERTMPPGPSSGMMTMGSFTWVLSGDQLILTTPPSGSSMMVTTLTYRRR